MELATGLCSRGGETTQGSSNSREEGNAGLARHGSLQPQLKAFLGQFEQLTEEARQIGKEPQQPQHGAVTTFKSLPIEIRFTIYELLLGERKTIVVACRKSRCTRSARPLDQVYGFLFVDKEIFAEAIGMLYKRRTFHMGNGPYGSTSMRNLKAMKQFLKQTPATYLITDLELVFYLFHRLWECSLKSDTFFTPEMKRSLPQWTTAGRQECIVSNSENTIKDCQAIIRAVYKHMPGLRSLRIWADESLRCSPHQNNGLSSDIVLAGGGFDATVKASTRSDNVQFMCTAVKEAFSRLEKLSSVRVLLDPRLLVKEVLMEALSTTTERDWKVSSSEDEDGFLVVRDTKKY